VIAETFLQTSQRRSKRASIDEGIAPVPILFRHAAMKGLNGPNPTLSATQSSRFAIPAISGAVSYKRNVVLL